MLAIIGLFQLHNWRIALVTASLFESQIDAKGLDLCEPFLCPMDTTLRIMSWTMQEHPIV